MRMVMVFVAGLLAAAQVVAARVEPQCPQPRFTDKAPAEYYRLENPLENSWGNRRAGRKIYRGGVFDNINCASCHGKKGDGAGPLSSYFDPPPRNFTCEETINGTPDGQLFWIVRFGSPGTEMPAHPELSDEQVWQLVLELRRLAHP